LPECAITGYTSQDFKTSWHVKTRSLRREFTKGVDPTDVAQTVKPAGSILTHFSALAKELSVYISIPFIEKDKFVPVPNTASFFKDDGDVAFYNTLALVNPKGELIAHYRKINLWPYVDYAWARPGKDVMSVETEYGRVGLGICYDVHVILERYKPHKLWTLLYSIGWVDDHPSNTKQWYNEYLPNRLKENGGGFNVIGANWAVDESQKWSGYGSSTIYSGTGTIISQATADLGDQIVYAELPFTQAS